MSELHDIGVIGLAVMGQNLILNFDDHGYRVVAYNRTASVTKEFIEDRAKGTAITGVETLEDMMSKLEKPRRVMLMVKAGPVVDKVIEQIVPLMEAGDIIIDGGNSQFTDTQRRADELAEKGFLFIGTGVSGGEDGARHGPSLMPGGHPDAWPAVKEMLQSIAAKTDDGEPCCDWVGEGGAGHYVKMVHNGIEYGDMQLICESYWFMKQLLELSNDEMQGVFTEWNKGELDSYLIEITADILGFQENDEYVLDTILDTAGQKGTGKWTAISAMQQGIPLTLIGEAVMARFLSALKDERLNAAKVLEEPAMRNQDLDDDVDWTDALGEALYACKIISYAQGYMLMRAAAEDYGWDLNYGGIAHMWREGCIIRAAFLEDIRAAFDNNPSLENLLLDDRFHERVDKAEPHLRKILCAGIARGLPMPAMSAALAFLDGYRSAELPANLLQAQRDYFGAHTYQRKGGDGSYHHTDWIGSDGGVSSGSYDA